MQPANPFPEAQHLSSNEFWPKPLNLDRPSEIDHDIALGPRAAYQRIAVGRRLNRVGPIADVAADERRLAIVADPGAARPSHRYIARLGISRRLWNAGSQRTLRPLRAKDTSGPVPTGSAGGCGGLSGAAAIPGVRDGPAPNVSV